MPAGGKFALLSMVTLLAAFAARSARAGGSFTAGTPDCNVVGGDLADGAYVINYCSGGQIQAGSCAPENFTEGCKPIISPCGTGMLSNKFVAYCSTAPRPQEESLDGAVAATGNDPAVPPAPPPVVDPYVAAQAALNAKAKELNDLGAAAIGERANEAGMGQASMIGAAKDVGAMGANQAATVGALYCAQGANDQVGNHPDLASQNYGSCKQYFDAAGAMRTGSGGYKEDSASLAGDMAKDTLAEFEKNFGVSGDDFMGRMLGSGGSRDELAEMTKGKLKPETVAKAFDEATPQGGDKFAVDLGGKGTVKKLSSAMRDSLRKSLDKEKEPARRVASAASGPTKVDAPRIKGLEPLADAFADVVKEKEAELTIFDVVRLKYREVAKRQDL